MKNSKINQIFDKSRQISRGRGTKTMLPFLKPKQIAGLIISHRKPDTEGQQKQDDTDDSNAPLEACAEDLIRAIHAKDAKAVAAAWKAGMDCMDSSDSDESYDSQNEKAAEYSEE